MKKTKITIYILMYKTATYNLRAVWSRIFIFNSMPEEETNAYV